MAVARPAALIFFADAAVGGELVAEVDGVFLFYFEKNIPHQCRTMLRRCGMIFVLGVLYYAVEFVSADEQRIALRVAETVDFKVNVK